MPEVKFLSFDEPEIVIPTTIRGKKYELHEAGGEASVTYKNAVAKCAKFNSDGKMTSATGLPETEILLVSLCLFPEGSTDHVSLAFVQTSLRHREIKKMVEVIREISELAADDSLEGLIEQREEVNKKIADIQKAQEAAKNEPEISTDGSD